MSKEHGLTPDGMKRRHPSDVVEKSSTFSTHGVDEFAAKEYLGTPSGTRYLQALRDADPNAPDSRIIDRALGQIRSGRETPQMEVINEPLVKIVPAGVQDRSLTYSPFFARQSKSKTQ